MMPRYLNVVALLTAFLFAPLVTHATAILGQGTWETSLKARDIDGFAVSLHDPRAAFFYDVTLDLTWLRDMNAGAGSAFDDGVPTPSRSIDGRMTFPSAQAWLNSLTYFGGGWRLPKTEPVDGITYNFEFRNNGTSDVGYSRTFDGDPLTVDAWRTASELGHLYYVTLGNLGFCPPDDLAPTSCPGTGQPGYGLFNTAYFVNLQPDAYWAQTSVTNLAWGLNFWQGYTFSLPTVHPTRPELNPELYVMAVRDGDVLREVESVASPGTLSLLLLMLPAAGFFSSGTRARLGATRSVYGVQRNVRMFPSRRRWRCSRSELWGSGSSGGG